MRAVDQQVGTALTKLPQAGGLVGVIHKGLVAKDPAQQVGIVAGQQRKPRLDGHGTFTGEVLDLAGEGLCRLLWGRGGGRCHHRFDCRLCLGCQRNSLLCGRSLLLRPSVSLFDWFVPQVRTNHLTDSRFKILIDLRICKRNSALPVHALHIQVGGRHGVRQAIKPLGSYFVLFKERTEGINVERRARRHKSIVTLTDFPGRDSKVVNPTSRLTIDKHIAHQGTILICKVREPPVELFGILVKGQRKRLGHRKVLRRRSLGPVRGFPLTGFGLGIQPPARLSLISRCNNAICTIGICKGRPRISCINILLILGKLKVQTLERFYGRIKGGVFVFELGEHRIS